MRLVVQKSISTCLIIGSSLILGCNSDARIESENKEIVQNALDAMNSQDFEGLRAYLSDNYTRHCQATPEDTITNAESFIALIMEWSAAFPDVHQTMQAMIAEGDKVAFQITFEGTHLAPMNGMPATGKKVSSEAFGYHRMENGKIAETWVTWDNVAILSQLGVFPPPAGGKQ